MTKKVSSKKKDHKTFNELIASGGHFMLRGQETVSEQTLRLNGEKCTFSQDRVITECLSCGFDDVNCWHADALSKLAFGLDEMSQALKDVLAGARFTAVDVQRIELGGPQPVVLLDWNTTVFPYETAPAFEALRHFHVVGRYYGPYNSIQDYLEDTGLDRFVVYEWSRVGCAWLPERSIKKVI